MLLHVLHRTTFRYAGPAHDSFNELRLRPPDNERQLCRRFDLRISPPAAHVRDYRDYYGNCVHYFDLAPVHHSLVIEAESEVETNPLPPPADSAASGAAEVNGSALSAVELQAEYLAPTTLVPLESPRWSEAQAALAAAGGRADAWTDAVHLGRHVHRTIRYQPLSTGVGTTAVDVLRDRTGVCQDFAHVLAGLCRTAGIPARYVSGYFLNDTRRPGEIEASHAWVQVYIAGHGWAAYDPTHDRPVDERYIQVATGRDYGDIRPVSGTYRGAPTQELRVEVEVREARHEKGPALPPGREIG